MRIISAGLLICLICLYIMIGFEGSSLMVIGGLAFWIGVIVSLVGIFYRNDNH